MALAFVFRIRKPETGHELMIEMIDFKQHDLESNCKHSPSNCARAQDPKTNQLIVGPLRWAYQLLRPTIGERFMDRSEARIFIDRSLIDVSTLRT